MNVSMTKKQQLIHQLLAAKSKAYEAEFDLLLKEMPYEANEVKSHGKKLSRMIDILLAEAMNDWLENSDKTISDVYLINKELQRCINDINYNVNVTENTVKLVGFIDDIVKIAAVII